MPESLCLPFGSGPSRWLCQLCYRNTGSHSSQKATVQQVFGLGPFSWLDVNQQPWEVAHQGVVDGQRDGVAHLLRDQALHLLGSGYPRSGEIVTGRSRLGLTFPGLERNDFLLGRDRLAVLELAATCKNPLAI